MSLIAIYLKILRGSTFQKNKNEKKSSSSVPRLLQSSSGGCLMAEETEHEEEESFILVILSAGFQRAGQVPSSPHLTDRRISWNMMWVALSS